MKKSDGALVARQEFEAQLKVEVEAARSDGEAIGACVALDLNIEFNRLMKMAVIYRVLKNKEYKQYGLTQSQFFKAIGEKERTIEEHLKSLSPIFEAFQAKSAYFTGCKINEIKLLGKEIQAGSAYFEDGCLNWQGEKYEMKEPDIKKLLGFIAESYEDRIKAEKKQTDRVKKQAEKEEAGRVAALKQLYEYNHINEMDADPWIALTRMELSKRWELFMSEWRAFALHNNALLNDNAQECMVEFYDRIFSDLDSINETRYEKTGQSYTRAKK
jgi:hypothetical protein